MVSKVKMFIFISKLFLCLGWIGIINASEINENAQNPIIWADVPDPSVVRVGDTYYMSSTTMHMSPGVPIMKSTDLVNWETVSYAYDILANSNAMNLRNGQDAYGKGSWASSIRYHDGTFYVVTFSYTTNKTHIYQTTDIENGPWSAYSFSTICHDPSLLFDDDRVFIVYGIDDIRIIELNSDATAIKSGGLNQVLIPNSSQIAGTSFYVSSEGSHIHKINGMYYVFLISWPAGSMRTELVYRSDTLTGPYEGRIVLQDDGVAQGGLIDTPDGDWYVMLFQDHGSVGRIPYLVPLTWEDDWPVLGVNGQVPDELDIPAGNGVMSGIVASDEFDWDSDMPLTWQWNHNPDNDFWSVTDRPGFLRITNGRTDLNFVETQNTLTQRTFGPECTGIVKMDVGGMQDGDVAGLGVLQEYYGFVGVKMSGTAKSVIMINARSGDDAVETVPLTQNLIYFRISCDFKYQRDRATFYYSLDGSEWHETGNTLRMSYELSHFMGYRFALFNYATESAGGYVDFDFFRISESLDSPSRVGSMNESIPTGFYLDQNYPNPFNPTTEIRYDVAQISYVQIAVYDITGRHVRTLVNEQSTPGQHTVAFDASDQASGLYIYKMTADQFAQTQNMILLK